MAFSSEELSKISKALSEPRFATYLQHCGNDRGNAMKLYCWNLEVSAAFIVPLHIFEVVIRNAVVDALEVIHTSNWPWNKGFQIALPDPARGYNPRKNLENIAQTQPTMGKVVAEMNFAFWEQMFTQRHDKKIWDTRIKALFPNSSASLNAIQLRKSIHDDIFQVRKLRNRIAHHEPVFSRNLQDDYDKMHRIVSWRDATTANWLNNIQSVSDCLTRKP